MSNMSVYAWQQIDHALNDPTHHNAIVLWFDYCEQQMLTGSRPGRGGDQWDNRRQGIIGIPGGSIKGKQ